MSISTCADVKKFRALGLDLHSRFLRLKDLSANNEAKAIGFVTSHFFPFFFFSPEEQGLASRALLMGSI